METIRHGLTTSPINEKMSRTTLWLFSIGTMVIGLLTAYLSFSLFPLDRTYNPPVIYLPLWVFWFVWLILYPSMGMAAGHVWSNRKTADVRGAMVFYASVLVTNILFLPIANVSNGNPAIMTFMDVNGIITALLLGWLFARYSRKAFLWLLPLIIWMPITAIFKVLLWLVNPI